MNSKNYISAFLVTAFLSLFAVMLQAQPCDGRLMVLGGYGDGKIYPIMIDKENLTSTTDEAIITLDDPAEVWDSDAMGYRWKDQTFYGLIRHISTSFVHIFAIDEGSNFSLTTTSNSELENGAFIYSGCVSNNQEHLILVENMRQIPLQENDPTRPNLLHKINLESGNYEMESILLHGIALSDTVGIFSSDIAFDPVTDIAYTIDRYTNRMVTIDINTGEIDNESYPPVNFDAYASFVPSSLFFDAFNRLYGLSADETGGYLFEFDKNTGTINQAYSFTPPNDTARFFDGCSCPFTVALEKELKIKNLRQCQTTEAVIKIAFLNDAIIAPVNFRDSFPNGVEILEVVHNPYGGTVSGINTNVLEIENMQPSFGIDSIIVRILVSEDMPGGDYTCQASLRNLDLSELGDERTTVYSDYPSSPAFLDATPFSIIESGTLEPNLLFELCKDQAVVLRPLENTDGLEFLWQDGSKADSLVVSSPGLYDVSINTGCKTLQYTIEVIPSELSIDLGEDLSILFGETLTITPSITSSSEIVSYKWEESDTSILSCLDCSSIEITPSGETATLSLLVTNENGCIAEDKISIEIKRPVYVPNAFSPNNDGRNDLFIINTPETIPFSNFQIYDRWGGMIWERKEGFTNTYKFGWNGISDNKVTPPGLYIWTIQLHYSDGVSKLLSGETNLVK
ncbi:MAG: gliding motility-associated C-terminal domain-containing protein [Chitinophagales bacterium]|nr:gliding motility-associated C-terminal domain-containing protein [Chitinophagales bacterium]